MATGAADRNRNSCPLNAYRNGTPARNEGEGEGEASHLNPVVTNNTESDIAAHTDVTGTDDVLSLATSSGLAAPAAGNGERQRPNPATAARGGRHLWQWGHTAAHCCTPFSVAYPFLQNQGKQFFLNNLLVAAYRVSHCAPLRPSAAKRDRFQRAVETIRQAANAEAGVCETGERILFCSPEPDELYGVRANGPRRANCPACSNCCRKGCRDPGYWGNHQEGVYLSPHPDYTFPGIEGNKRGARGTVVACLCVLGKVCHLTKPNLDMELTAGYHCHESSRGRVYFLFNPDLCLPAYEIQWEATQDCKYLAKDDEL